MSESIRLVNVEKAAPDGRKVLGGVSLILDAGEQAHICGAAGSGKTSLLRLIAGMDKPVAGQVFVAGQALHEMEETETTVFRSRTVGVCLRNPALLPFLSIWENTALPLAISGIPLGKRKQPAMEQLKALGIAYAAHALPEALSPYELRLAALARALAAGPPVLLLDELAADLPERDAARLMEMVWTLAGQRSLTVVACTSGQCLCHAANRYFTMDHGTVTEVYR